MDPLIKIVRYSADMKQEWDRFVSDSRNATFLMQRDYMDYHSDRFEDCSWLAYKGSRLLALLPANLAADGTLHSHQGLTYGGWLLPQAHLDGADLLGIFTEAIGIWSQSDIKKLEYKVIPEIYASRPSQEDIYALFRLGASLRRCDLSSALPLKPLRTGTNSPDKYFNKLRRRALSATSKLNFEICRCHDADIFMHLVESCLTERHNTRPVHTAEELQLLIHRFPDRIRLYTLIYQGEAHAAVAIYDTGRVHHAQYIATTPLGRELNLLTPLFRHLILLAANESEAEYFDFGISNEQAGLYLSEGLLRQKASFGATGLAHLFFSLDL